MNAHELVEQFESPHTRNEAMARLSGHRGARAARGKLLSPEKRAALIWGLGHASPAVRRCCLELLDTHPDEDAIPAIVALLSDPVPRVRWHAVHALACDVCKAGRSLLVAPAAEGLRRVADSDPNRRVREYAMRVLAEADDGRTEDT